MNSILIQNGLIKFPSLFLVTFLFCPIEFHQFVSTKLNLKFITIFFAWAVKMSITQTQIPTLYSLQLVDDEIIYQIDPADI